MIFYDCPIIIIILWNKEMSEPEFEATRIARKRIKKKEAECSREHGNVNF